METTSRESMRAFGSIPFVFLLGILNNLQAITITGTTDEGQDAWKIRTETATYFFQKKAGGFSSIVDNDGNDWISFHPKPAGYPGAASGKYRGIPNLVHPGDVFHPGYSHCTSSLTEKKDRVTIQSESPKEGGWRITWDIHETHATLTVLKKSRPYWFLYEGTPAGRETPKAIWYMSSLKQAKTNCSKPQWNADLPGPEWICFGGDGSPYVLLLVHHEDDKNADEYYWMDAGNGKGMTVFGFGRKGVDPKLINTVPAHFSISLFRSTDHDTIHKRSQEIITGNATSTRLHPMMNAPLDPISGTYSHEYGGSIIRLDGKVERNLFSPFHSTNSPDFSDLASGMVILRVTTDRKRCNRRVVVQ